MQSFGQLNLNLFHDIFPYIWQNLDMLEADEKTIRESYYAGKFG